ncbi:MAG: hypothetical protein J7621_17360 [Niastella sp.]|nr:hypothetical protein [Niastella sp.]
MKKILYYNTIFFLLIALLTSCEKQGPDGPEGPEGPAGNPGPPGNSGSTGSGAVIAYTTDPANIFGWVKNGSVASSYTLGRKDNSGSDYNYDLAFYVEDREGVIPDGIVLVYVKMKKKNSTQEAVWFAMPHLSGNMAAGSEEYTAHQNYRDQSGNNDYLAVRITGDIAQASPTAATPPSYDASGVKIIVIASGEVIIGSRSADVRTLSLEEVMERYNIKETDFKVLR